MIKAIIFDFDGVIVESADIKTEAFRKLFSSYPDKVDRIVNHHLENMGISRYVKFRYIFENILHKELTQNEEAQLGERFSQIVLGEILKAPFVAGVLDFFKNCDGRYQLFIASGTPQDELDHVVLKRGLKDYFRGIYGSPRQKLDIIESILRQNNILQNEAVFVGDAESDLIAAKETGIYFIARISADNGDLLNCDFKIRDLFDLKDLVEKLSC